MIYLVVGGLGRVLQGSDELTEGVDVVPLMREENLGLLEAALEDLVPDARTGSRWCSSGILPAGRCSSSRPTPAS